MSHYTVGIIVPPQYLDDYEAYVATQMAPFDENLIVATYVNAHGETQDVYNPEGRFDYFEINGPARGWTGDIFTVEEILSSGNYLPLPSSMVTPDGLWHDAGPMSYQRLLNAFLGHSVVILDAHV